MDDGDDNTAGVSQQQPIDSATTETDRAAQQETTDMAKKKATSKTKKKPTGAKSSKSARVARAKTSTKRKKKSVTADELPAGSSMKCTGVEKHGARYIKLAFGEQLVSIMPVNLLGADIDKMRDKLYAWLSRLVL